MLAAKYAAPILLAAGAIADSCIVTDACDCLSPEDLDGSEESFGLNVSTFYPYDDKVEVVAFAPQSSVSALKVVCREASSDGYDDGTGPVADYSLDITPVAGETACTGGNTKAFAYNMTAIRNFNQISLQDGADVKADYTVTCTLYNDDANICDGICTADCEDALINNDATLYSKTKAFELTFDEELDFSITSQDITTSAESASDSTEEIDLQDLVEVVLNNDEAIVFKEGALETLTFTLRDITDDAVVDGLYQIVEVTTLDLDIDNGSATVSVVAASEGTSNVIGFSEDYVTANVDAAVLSFILKADRFLAAATNINVSGVVQTALADGTRRRNDLPTEGPVSFVSAAASYQSASSAAASVVSAATMIGVPAAAASMC